MIKQNIKNALEHAHKIALFGHEHIDGDALGAMLGLGRVLEKQGKQIAYFTPHEPSRIFNFLELGTAINYHFDYGDYDLIVFLDFNQYERISLFTLGHENYFDEQKKIIIDHHKPEEEPQGTLIFRDVAAISTCLMLYELIKEWRPNLFDQEIATYLYMGLSTDSGNFRYDEGEQSVRAFTVAAELLKLGANKKLIIDEIFRSKSYRSVVFMKHLLSRMQKIKIQTQEHGIINLIYSFYDDAELEEFGIDHDEADYGLHIMQDIRNNELVVLVKRVGMFVKTSLRSRGAVDCSALAKSFGGGGHHNAAGFKIQGSCSLDKDIQDILSQIKDFFAH